MTTIRITKFVGTAPKVSSELLGDGAAQIALHCKMATGDLVPMPRPVTHAGAGRTGEIKTLYALRDPDTAELKWLTWLNHVSVATPATDEYDEQRFYYTGDGTPKMSTYAKATAGAGPYPSGYYELGLPLPTATPTATPTSFTTVNSASFARDGGNNITLVLDTDHSVKDGAVATISGFSFITGTYSQSVKTITVTITDHGLVTGSRVYLEFTSGTALAGPYVVTVTGTDTFTVMSTVSATTSGDVRWDIRDLNITTEVTVINDTTITYFAPGPQVATTANTEGALDLGGQVQSRSYVYTWYTPWAEESIGSEPSTPMFIKEGQIVTVSGLPTAPPAGSNFIRGMRLYRTLAGVDDADYFRLATLWFPQPVASFSRTSNVSTVVCDEPHNLIEGDRFKLSGCSEASFDITDGIVVDAPSQYAFTYAQTDTDVASTVAATGTLYHDTAESLDDAARYWGDISYDFVDDFNYRSLLNTLGSNDYDAPPAGLQGLVVIQNTMLAGFVGNDLYFSEPAALHAWPAKYKKTLEHRIVALVAMSTDLLVLTEAYPYIVSGSDPAVLSVAKINAQYPCVSARSVASTPFGAMYATHGGVALYSFSSGAALATQKLHSQDTWNETLDPAEVVGAFYNESYIASHSGGMLVLERDAEGEGYIVDSSHTFTATWYDSLLGDLYYTTGVLGDIKRWDGRDQPAEEYDWKSKTYITQTPINMGAARVVADYAGTSASPLWEVYDENWEAVEDVWDITEPVTFRFWAGKTLLLTTTLSSSLVFRLPAGYKSDTFEVGVSGAVRIRAIHLGVTPSALMRS